MFAPSPHRPQPRPLNIRGDCKPFPSSSGWPSAAWGARGSTSSPQGERRAPYARSGGPERFGERATTLFESVYCGRPLVLRLTVALTPSASGNHPSRFHGQARADRIRRKTRCQMHTGHQCTWRSGRESFVSAVGGDPPCSTVSRARHLTHSPVPRPLRDRVGFFWPGLTGLALPWAGKPFVIGSG